ncbi:MAG: TIGR02266 family protein, partial [Myxococcota bacterium]
MTEKRKTDRHGVSLLVKLRYPDVRSFAERYASNLSKGGMFIVTREPRGVGSTLLLEVQIAGGQRVLRGEAIVRWVRSPGEPGGPPGMGLQFLELDQPSMDLLEKIV